MTTAPATHKVLVTTVYFDPLTSRLADDLLSNVIEFDSAEEAAAHVEEVNSHASYSFASLVPNTNPN